MLKKMVVVLGVVVVFLLIIPAFLPSKMQLSRSIEIQASQAVVHGYLSDLNQYPKWNPFSEGDATSANQISGAGVGQVLVWKGEKTGEGKMTITEMTVPQRIVLKLEFYTPMAGEALIGWNTEAIDPSMTRMTWSMDQDLPYFQRYFGLVMGSMIGKTFERGLDTLKRQLEKS
jgi:hypothetical protein